MLDDKKYTGSKTDVPDFLKVLLTLKKNIMKDLNVAEVCKILEVKDNSYMVAPITNPNVKLKCYKLSSLDVKKDDLVLVVFTNTDYRLNLNKINNNKPTQPISEELLHSLNYGIITGFIGDSSSTVYGTKVTVGGIVQDIWNADTKANQSELNSLEDEFNTFKTNTNDKFNNYVTLDTDQAITGPKRFRGNLKVSAMDIDLDTIPTSTQWRYLDFVDKDGARLGVIGARFNTDGKAGMYMQSRNNGSIGIRVGSTGQPFAWAPSTGVFSNSDEIATSNFVRNTTMGAISNIIIPANTNLNTTNYLKIGTYICDANTTATTLTNSPTDLGFIMHVLSPLGDNKTPGTDTYVYRVRRITTYTGLEFIQSVEAGNTSTLSYGDWKIIKHGSQYTDGYKAIWENQSAGDHSATITLDYRVPRGLLFVGKTSTGTYQNTYMPFGYCKNRTVYLFHSNRDAYLGGNLTTKVNNPLGTLGCSITVSLDVLTQGSWASNTQSAYFVY